MTSSPDLRSMGMESEFLGLLESKEAGLAFYSPFSFLHRVDPVMLCRETFTGPLIKDISTGKTEVTLVEIEGRRTWFAWRSPVWDSEYFKRKVIRVELILPDHGDARILGRAITGFAEGIAGKKGIGTALETTEGNIGGIAGSIAGETDGCGTYISVNIPCEDLLLVRSVAYTGFRLVETRLNYLFDSFDHVTAPADPVRQAVQDDIPVLREVAMKMRNRFDRVHADPAFSDEVADAYLGTFIEQSVKGFADIVMVPDMAGVKPFGFLAADNPVEVMGTRIAKLVLAAADNSGYKGWLSKLLSAVLFELKHRGTDILTTITQASNRPAIRSWEKAGFRLGYVTHLYSYSR